MLRRALVLVCVLAAAAGSALAQSNRIDTVTPSAPELAPYGKYAIGVRTVQATDKNRPDILNTKEGGPTAALRSDADPRSLVSGRAGGRAEARRRLPRDHARPRDHRHAAWPGRSRRRAPHDRARRSRW